MVSRQIPPWFEVVSFLLSKSKIYHTKEKETRRYRRYMVCLALLYTDTGCRGRPDTVLEDSDNLRSSKNKIRLLIRCILFFCNLYIEPYILFV